MAEITGKVELPKWKALYCVRCYVEEAVKGGKFCVTCQSDIDNQKRIAWEKREGLTNLPNMISYKDAEKKTV